MSMGYEHSWNFRDDGTTEYTVNGVPQSTLPTEVFMASFAETAINASALINNLQTAMMPIMDARQGVTEAAAVFAQSLTKEIDAIPLPMREAMGLPITRHHRKRHRIAKAILHRNRP